MGDLRNNSLGRNRVNQFVKCGILQHQESSISAVPDIILTRFKQLSQ